MLTGRFVSALAALVADILPMGRTDLGCSAVGVDFAIRRVDGVPLR